VDVHVRRLRESIDARFATDSIETIRGVDYRCAPRAAAGEATADTGAIAGRLRRRDGDRARGDRAVSLPAYALRPRSQIDRGLRSRGADVRALVAQADTGLRDGGAARARGPGADVAQILRADGRIFDATPGLSRGSLLTPHQVSTARRGALSIARATTPIGPTRLLATPLHAQEHDLVVVVGAPLVDRDQALASLDTLLLVGGAGALLLASLAGYGLASGALRPVESMRRRAASISSEDLHGASSSSAAHRTSCIARARP
jgi:hypothetical protein